MGAKKLQDHLIYENLVSEELRPHLNWDRIAICEEASPQDVISMAISSQYTHICQPAHPYFAADLNSAAQMLADPDKFSSFPISAILSPGQLSLEAEAKHTLFARSFSQIREKPHIIEGIKESLAQHTISKSILTDVLSIADELVTNAVFNAPFVDLGNTLPGASRDDLTVKMDSGKCGQIFLGADTTRLVIGCRDPYGTLNLMKLFERVKKCYDISVGEAMNKTGAGGAGIGSFMVFVSAASYYALVSEGTCTMICCVLPLKMSGRMRAELPKNLHYSIHR